MMLRFQLIFYSFLFLFALKYFIEYVVEKDYLLLVLSGVALAFNLLTIIMLHNKIEKEIK